MLLLLCHFSHVRLCATPETAAHQAPPPLGFSWQEHWSGLPFPSPTKDEPQTNESYRIRKIIIKILEYTHTHICS